jgi:hypothetical protein
LQVSGKCITETLDRAGGHKECRKCVCKANVEPR